MLKIYVIGTLSNERTNNMKLNSYTESGEKSMFLYYLIEITILKSVLQ